MQWPSDVDGDVMRRLSAAGFDFDRSAQLDFNVDFEHWPPADEAIVAIKTTLPDATVSLQDDYVLVQVERRVSYELVKSMQANLTALTTEFGGWCDSWGVLH